MMPQSIVTSLLTGHCPDVPVWDLNKAARLMADGLVTDPARYDAAGVWKAANALNRERYFELTQLLGAAWDAGRPFNSVISKHYAQALINLGLLDQADALLDKAIDNVKKAAVSSRMDVELSEYKGLKARICKQRFVEHNDSTQLFAAFDSYYATYLEDRRSNYWHGVNALALLARAERDSFGRLAQIDSITLAEQLFNEVNSRNGDSVWELATMSEICLARGHCDQAELWLYRLLYSPDCTSFILDSFGRQLREIWKARSLDGGSRCQDKLASIIAKHQMSRLSVLSLVPPKSPDEQNNLEMNFSGAGCFSVDTIQDILKACASIACVCNQRGVRLGTGFMIEAASLGLAREGKVFVTNAHVLSDAVAGAIPIADARVTFELALSADGMPRFHKIGEVIFSSPPGPLGQVCAVQDFLDVTVVSLKDFPLESGSLKISGGLPIIDGQAKAYVIGHPRGSGLQIAVHDSELLAVDDSNRLVHYRTPTDPGSSGSPVFNEDWNLIALHHGGSSSMPRFTPKGSVYQANEGVTIEAIRTGIGLAMAAAAQAATTP